MPVAFDATILLPMLSPTVPTPVDRATSKPIEFVKERIDFLLKQLENTRTKIIVPTPALSEILVHADEAAPGYLNQLEKSSAFEIKPFDTRAAVEVALMTRAAIQAGDKRCVKDSWAKVKFDRQIIAVAKVNMASVIYSDDEGVIAFAEQAGLTAVAMSQLPLPPPPDPTQIEMFKEPGEATVESAPEEVAASASEDLELRDNINGEADTGTDDAFLPYPIRVALEFLLHAQRRSRGRRLLSQDAGPCIGKRGEGRIILLRIIKRSFV